MFAQALGRADPVLRFSTVRITGGEVPPDPATVEAVLVTGSAAGVYDDLAWIAPLEDFVRTAYGLRIPMVGICFGHQLIAQALGGIVRKAEVGWGIGRHIYSVAPDNGLIAAPEVAVACSHQDQVITAPTEARTILRSDFTPHAGFLYANGTTLTLQPHPEFTAGYALTRCEARVGQAPDAVVVAGRASLEKPLDSGLLNQVIAQFLKSCAGS